jgi:hypothetical protein
MASDSAALKPALTATSSEVTGSDEQISPLKALTGIIIRPAETLARLRDSKKGYWWLVFSVTLVTAALSAIASASVQARAFAGLSAAASKATTSASGGAAALPAAAGSSLTNVALTLAGGAVLLLLDYCLRALIVFGMGLVLGGKASLKQAFRMSVWTTIPYALRHLVQGGAMFAAGQPSVSGLSAVLTTAESETMPILNLVLGMIDFYMLWSALLLGIGVVVTAKVSRGKGLATVVAYLGLALAGSLALYAASTALGSLASGSLGSLLGGGATPGGAGPGGMPSGGGGPPGG